MAMTPEQRRKNLRLAVSLATVAVVFAIGFVARIWLANNALHS